MKKGDKKTTHFEIEFPVPTPALKSGNYRSKEILWRYSMPSKIIYFQRHSTSVKTPRLTDNFIYFDGDSTDYEKGSVLKAFLETNPNYGKRILELASKCGTLYPVKTEEFDAQESRSAWIKEIQKIQWYFHLASALRLCRNGDDILKYLVSSPKKPNDRAPLRMFGNFGQAPIQHLRQNPCFGEIIGMLELPELESWNYEDYPQYHVTDENGEQEEHGWDDPLNSGHPHTTKGVFHVLAESRKKPALPIGHLLELAETYRMTNEDWGQQVVKENLSKLWQIVIHEIKRNLGEIRTEIRLNETDLSPRLELRTNSLGALGRAWFEFYLCLESLETTRPCCRPGCSRSARNGTFHCGNATCKRYGQRHNEKSSHRAGRPIGVTKEFGIKALQ
jgi:hypothetical protein